MLTVTSTAAQTIPKISVEVGQANKPGDLSVTLQIVILMTVLALAPSILMMITSFIRITVVLSFLRHAIGTQQMPPNQLLVGLALILTFFIMAPIGTKSYNEGIKPYLDQKITKEEAFDKAVAPFRKFMLAQTREQDLALFVNMAELPAPNNADDIPLHVLVPGFRDLRTAYGVSDIVRHFHSVSGHRHGRVGGADVDGYDDAAADRRLSAVQDSAVRAGRRLVSAGQVACGIVQDVRDWTMTPQMVVSIGREALMVTLLVSAPMLIFGLVIGLVISIFQAVTQINEMTLTFVPKILAVALALLIFLALDDQHADRFHASHVRADPRIGRIISADRPGSF